MVFPNEPKRRLWRRRSRLQQTGGLIDEEQKLMRVPGSCGKE
jgi:hypothetical protein